MNVEVAIHPTNLLVDCYIFWKSPHKKETMNISYHTMGHTPPIAEVKSTFNVGLTISLGRSKECYAKQN